MVPYLWRRHLGVFRAFLAICCAIIYLADPPPSGYVTACVAGLYALYSIFILVRDKIASGDYPFAMLVLDGILFILCSLHPSQEGVWLTGVTYFYLLCLAALLYSWRQVSFVVAFCLIWIALAKPLPVRALWPTFLMAGVLAVILSIQKGFLERRLSAALKRSVISRSDAETARESERERIAADFHDGPLQSFISFQMRLEIVRKLLLRDPEAAMRELQQLQDLGKSQVAELRLFVRNMQPLAVDVAGLQASIRQIVHSFETDSGIITSLICSNELPDTMEADLATEVLQIIREALNNIRKHSKASRVTVVVEPTEDAIEISVEDDGSGFPFSGSYTLDELELLRLGPRSIKRRIRTLGGDLMLESRPMQGAGLRMRIPT